MRASQSSSSIVVLVKIDQRRVVMRYGGGKDKEGQCEAAAASIQKQPGDLFVPSSRQRFLSAGRLFRRALGYNTYHRIVFANIVDLVAIREWRDNGARDPAVELAAFLRGRATME
jgi:hypothetical protein